MLTLTSRHRFVSLAFAGAVLAYVVKKNPQIKTWVAYGDSCRGFDLGVFVLKESDPFVTKGALLLIGTAAMIVTGYALRETKPNLFVGSKPLAWFKTVTPFICSTGPF